MKLQYVLLLLGVSISFNAFAAERRPATVVSTPEIRKLVPRGQSYANSQSFRKARPVQVSTQAQQPRLGKPDNRQAASSYFRNPYWSP